MTEQAPATGTENEPAETVTSEEVSAAAADLAKEVEKWKAQSRKHEERAKANAEAAKRVEELERQNMTELEQAVAKARDEATATVRAEMGASLAAEAIRAAATGRVADVDALLEGVNPAKWLDENGSPDRDAIAAWIDRVAPPKTEPEQAGSPLLPPGFYDLAQGTRSAATSTEDPLESALTKITQR